jgi:hypothetical protein
MFQQLKFEFNSDMRQTVTTFISVQSTSCLLIIFFVKPTVAGFFNLRPHKVYFLHEECSHATK